MDPISVAIKGKGHLNFLRRGLSITRRYGMTSGKMARALAQFADVLRGFGCSATFPITSVALERNPHVARKYQAQGIEFAVHGYRHLDHSELARSEQRTQLELARLIFQRAGIQSRGFRSPYLRCSPDTLAALRHQGFMYDSSQGISWDVLGNNETPAYRQALDFYGALSASDYPSLPSLERDLVRIPYSLPDDEALVDRLALKAPEAMADLWLDILIRTYELGELFTIGLHPERIALLEKPLQCVLRKARHLMPVVWIARLDEIAGWWRARAEAKVKVTDISDSTFRLRVIGPDEVTVLARGVQVDVPTINGVDGYREVEGTMFTACAPLRPFIGLSPGTSSALANFLRQQGYIVEVSEERHLYPYYFDHVDFSSAQERPLLTCIEETDRPLVRLGRWPKGARSALAITGDIDALTVWDYGLRILGG